MRAVDLNVKAGKLADTYEHMQVWLDQNGELHSLQPRCFLQVPDHRLHHCVGRVHEERDQPSLRDQLAKER
jgi:hypothetical protein